jgi:hypothetical protein
MTEINWDHVKDVIDNLAAEATELKRFQELDVRGVVASIRQNLTEILDMDHDGFPSEEVLVNGNGSRLGIPVEFADILVKILAFGALNNFYFSDDIKASIER